MKSRIKRFLKYAIALFVIMSLVPQVQAKHCDERGGCDCDCSWANSSTCVHDDGSCCWGCCCTGGGGGTAGTTRYWDCNQPFCEPGNIPYPHAYRMGWNSDKTVIYGHAAASDSILKGKTACEKCYQLDKSGSTPVIVKVDNWCPCQYNPSCCQDHFDLAVPGFDYASSSVSNVCQQHDSSMNYSTGHQACQNWPGQACICDDVSTDPGLNDACKIFLTLNWDNPQVNYKAVSCPFELQDHGTQVGYVERLSGKDPQ